MRQNIEFEESDLNQIKQHLKSEKRGKEYAGQITNQSAIEEAIRVSNICLKHLSEHDLKWLTITTNHK